MADITASGLLLRDCATIGADQTLADVMRALLSAQKEPARPNAVAVDAPAHFPTIAAIPRFP